MASRQEINFNQCYEYSITLCATTYVLPAYEIQGGIYSLFLLNKPIDPENEECLAELDWNLELVYQVNYPSSGDTSWVLRDDSNTILAYIDATDPNVLPTAPYASEWSIVEGTDGALIVDFSIASVSCPLTSCSCSISVVTDILGEAGYYTITLDGYPVGTFNGKTIYRIYDTDYGDLAVYWDSIENRWAIDDWDTFLSGRPSPVYLVSSSDCPDGVYTNNPEYEGDIPIENVVVSINNCYTYPNIDDYCCVSIGFSNGIDVIQYNVTLEIEYWGGIGDIPTYSFTMNNQDYGIIFNSLTNRWEILNKDASQLIAYSTTLSDVCPISSFSDWVITEEGYDQIGDIGGGLVELPPPTPIPLYDSLYIYSCNEDVDVPESGNAGEESCEPYEPCRNKNLLSKSAMELSKDIASLSKRQVFGFKCDDAWENIFMRSLIIDALSCSPYGTYSEEVEQCLIGKLTDKCNC
jgi:hypothetical protein